MAAFALEADIRAMCKGAIPLELRLDGQQSHEPRRDAAGAGRMGFGDMDGWYCTVIFQPDDAPVPAGQAKASFHVGLEEFGKPA